MVIVHLISQNVVTIFYKYSALLRFQSIVPNERFRFVKVNEPSQRYAVNSQSAKTTARLAILKKNSLQLLRQKGALARMIEYWSSH